MFIILFIKLEKYKILFLKKKISTIYVIKKKFFEHRFESIIIQKCPIAIYMLPTK